LFAALVAREQLGRALPIAHLGHEQGECADPGDELAGLVAVAVALPLLTALVGRDLELLGDLGIQDLIQVLIQALVQARLHQTTPPGRLR